MKILLDTHIWLWFLLGVKDLPKRWRNMLEDEGNELWLSPVSIWETLILAEKGRLQLSPDSETWIRQSWDLLLTREAKLTREVAMLSRKLALDHQDPADRFIGASSQFYGLTLMTMDKSLRRCPGIESVPLRA